MLEISNILLKLIIFKEHNELTRYLKTKIGYFHIFHNKSVLTNTLWNLRLSLIKNRLEEII